jgi:mRNA interferase MazF
MKGELFWVLFSGQGSQQQGLRPAVVVQNNFISGTSISTIVVCPLTTVIRRLKSQPIIPALLRNGLQKDSAVMCEQVAVVNKSQFQERMGVLSDDELQAVEAGLLFALDIDRG